MCSFSNIPICHIFSQLTFIIKSEYDSGNIEIFALKAHRNILLYKSNHIFYSAGVVTQKLMLNDA